MDAYEIVKAARDEGRKTSVDYINEIVEDFMEFHGDRLHGDDKAIIAGIGRVGKFPVTVIGVEKGKNTQDRITHNFGSAKPEGYRKALRLMKQAEKFHRPVICFVDTAGAFCDVASEENGQGRAIADNLFEMSDLKTPILSIVIGEGGSGGALALSHSDRIWMMEDAYFSVVSPESCANILWKTTEKAPEAAAALSLTAKKLYKLGIIDKICSKGDQKGNKEEIEKELDKLMNTELTDLLEARYRKFRTIGY
ncbi:carboxyltransferase subunit alpha [Butyrivibrio sp. MC2021]|uniref:carboxyltransferase subunit alpha n=1 Tax=Butyrivibrio sp. MC2021 TaxID=1408306 RepID=UPI00047D2AF5|nr:carboxyltransferase subunit alpha [Butyrivibrio sp. MC2021]